MEIENFLYLLDDPNRITENDLNQLEDLVAEYPYFQIAHILIAKGTQNRKSVLAPQKVRRAATYAYDRNLLRRMIEENYNHVLKAATSQKQHTQILEPQALPEEFVEVDSMNVFETDNLESENITVASEHQQDLESTLPNQVESKYSEVDTNLVESIHQGELTEGLAMDLYNEGKLNEAVYVYEQLITANPSRKDYFVTQVRVLTDDDTYDFDIENLPVIESEKENIESEIIDETQDEEIQVVSFSEMENPDVQQQEEIEEKQLEENLSQEDIVAVEENEAPLSDANEEPSFFETDNSDLSTTELDELSVNNEESLEEQKDNEEIESIYDSNPEAEAIEAELTQENINVYDDSVTETLALSYYQKGEVKNSIEVYQKLLIKYPDRESYYYGRIKDLEGELQQQEEANLTKLNPNELSTETTSFFDSLDEDLEKIEETNEDSSISEKKAIQLFNEKRYQEAIAVYELLVAQDSEKADYYLKQIEVLRQEQDFQQKTSDLQEDSTPTVVEDNHLNDEVSEAKAMALYSEGKREEAMTMYQTLIQEEPEKKAYYESQLAILSDEGNTNTNLSNSDFSSEVSTQENTIDENTAMNLFIEGKVEEAIKIYEQLSSLYPDRADYFQKQIEVLKSE